MTNYEAILRAPHPGSVELIEQIAPFTVVVRDIGATTSFELWIGNTFISAYRGHTRHPRVAMDAASDLIASTFKPLLTAAATDAGLTPYDATYEPNEGDDEMPWARR